MARGSGVPLIDISSLADGTEAERAATIAQIAEACERIGFFVLAGHGVSEDLITRCHDDVRAFFDLPADVKKDVQRPSAGVSRGWFAVAEQYIASSMGQERPPDLHEAFTIGPVDAPAGDWADNRFAVHFAPNLWPAEPGTLRDNATAYYRAMIALATRLMSAFALALELPEDYFATKIDQSPSNLRFINYPDQPEEPKPGQMRAAEHTDFGTLTILRVEDAPGGLQVRDRVGDWHDVGYVDGTFVINIGDAMARWTNDKWVSTLHRVANPPRDKALGSRRISIPFFHHANYDTVIECIPSCLPSGDEPKYAPITAGEHWRRKNEAMKVGRAS